MSSSPETIALTKQRLSSRWTVLSIYTLNLGIGNMLAYQFASVLIPIQDKYGVSELLASTLVLVSSVFYILVSIPAGHLVDQKGYIYSTRIGIIIQIIFSWIRVATESFWILLLCEIGIAIAQPFILNSISKLIFCWFQEDEAAQATGFGTVGIFIGIGVALITTPFLYESIGIRFAMLFYACITTAIGALFLFNRQLQKETSTKESLPEQFSWSLLRNRHLLLLYFLSFIGLGIFNGVITFLETILSYHDLSSTTSGVVGGLIILAGIIGTLVISIISDMVKARKPLLILCTVAAFTFLVPLCISYNYPMAAITGMIFGFSLLPAFSLLLEMCAEMAGDDLAGSATSILMLSGNAGGVVVILAIGGAGDLTSIITGLMIITGAGLIGTLFTKETYMNSTLNV